jgi:GntR family transcriptional repressor for pyruvate dehydrogenase complex
MDIEMSLHGLKAVKRQTTQEAVTEALKEYIINNKLKKGDRLPPEHDLCEVLGVSRNILRESMRHFRALGIIDSKPRVGAYIRRLMPDNPFGGYMPFMGRDDKSLSEILESRIVFECGAVPLLIERCGSGDIDDLREIVTAFGSSVKEMKVKDIEFHRRLMEITGNRILMSVAPLTVDFFEGSRGPGKSRNSEDIKRDHFAIIDALEQKDANALQTALLRHYKTYKKADEK